MDRKISIILIIILVLILVFVVLKYGFNNSELPIITQTSTTSQSSSNSQSNSNLKAPTDCSTISNQTLKDDCYFDVAIATNNTSICNTLVTPFYQEQCDYHFVDLGFCNMTNDLPKSVCNLTPAIGDD